jgi:hypothetical protein
MRAARSCRPVMMFDRINLRLFTGGKQLQAERMHSASPGIARHRGDDNALSECPRMCIGISCFDIFGFPFSFNPGTNGKNVEMSIDLSGLLADS